MGLRPVPVRKSADNTFCPGNQPGGWALYSRFNSNLDQHCDRIWSGPSLSFETSWLFQEVAGAIAFSLPSQHSSPPQT